VPFKRPFEYFQDLVKRMRMTQKRILIVEDDADSAAVLQAYLKRDGFSIAIAPNGGRAVDMYRQWKPDLVVLDVMLPVLSGTEVLTAIRRSGDTPVIMLTAVADVPEKVGALRYGADDYVVKPCSPNEVVARVHAVLRRARASGMPAKLLRYQHLVVDLDAVVARVEDTVRGPLVLDLTRTEFNLLVTLLRAPSKAFTRAELLESCLPDSEATERVIDAHVHNLRKKLERHGVRDVLTTVRSVGYRFQEGAT
jgi:two-component system, OmpR family, response regulator AdeR